MDDCCIIGLNDEAIYLLLASLSKKCPATSPRVHNPATGEFKITFKQMGLINSILDNLNLILTDSSSEPQNPTNPQTTSMADVLHLNPKASPYSPHMYHTN